MQTTIDIFRINRDPMPNVRFTAADDKGHKWHTLRIEDREYGDVTLNIHTENLDELLDFGYAIVKACRELQTDDVGSTLIADAEPAFVPFAINDAVEHEQASELVSVECGEGWSFGGKVCKECGKTATHKAYKEFLCKEHFEQIPF